MSSSAQLHRALLIPDVLDIIIDHLEPADLARLGRTCTTFNPPSMRRLWRHGGVRSFKALTGLWITDYDSMDLPQRLNLTKNWKRFQHYAKHVRSLDLMNPPPPPPADGRPQPQSEKEEIEVGDLLAALAVFGRQCPLLPHLRKLSFYAREPHDLAGAMLFLGPELEHLEIVANPPDDDNPEKDWALPIACMLELVPVRSPNLRELGLGFKISPRHLEALAETVERMPLTALGCETLALDKNVFKHLAQSKILKALQIGAITFDKLGSEAVTDDPEIRIDFASTVTPWSFPALKTLHIHESISVIQSLLDVLRTECEDLCLRFYPEDRFTDYQLSSIARSVRDHHRTVRRLELCFRERERQTPIAFSTFSPLFQCPWMMHFTFNYFSSTSLILTNSDILDLSLAWPYLRTLEIDWLRRHGSTYGLQNESDLTLQALHHLASNCPQLRQLVLESFDAHLPLASSPSHPLPPPAQPPKTHAFEFRVGRTPHNLNQAAQVAAWLACVWPRVNLKPLDRWCADQEAFWGSVREMIEVVRVVRAWQTWDWAVPLPGVGVGAAGSGSGSGSGVGTGTGMGMGTEGNGKKPEGWYAVMAKRGLALESIWK